MLACARLLIAEDQRPDSTFYGKLDETKIGAAGHPRLERASMAQYPDEFLIQHFDSVPCTMRCASEPNGKVSIGAYLHRRPHPDGVTLTITLDVESRTAAITSTSGGPGTACRAPSPS